MRYKIYKPQTYIPVGNKINYNNLIYKIAGVFCIDHANKFICISGNLILLVNNKDHITYKDLESNYTGMFAGAHQVCYALIPSGKSHLMWEYVKCINYEQIQNI